jgi:hypothetical protein
MAKATKPLSHPFLKVDSQYIDKNGEFPDRTIDPASKGDAYCMEWAKGIYTNFIGGRASWGVSDFGHMNDMRLYAMAAQSVAPYQKMLLDEDDDSPNTGINDMPISRVAKREGWYNVLWTPISLAPKLINNIIGLMEGADYDIFVNAIDSSSRDMEETAKAKAYILSMNKQFLLQYKQNAGLPTDEEQQVPDNPYEIGIIENMDGFKVNYAKGMQKLIRHSLEVSRWDDVLDKKLKTDLLTCRRCATKDYYDPEDKKFKTKYIDVARAGVQYSNDLDFTDAEYAFYCELVTISELRIHCPQLSEKELWSIASANFGLFGNPSSFSGAADILADPLYQTADCPWNNFYISVFQAEWMDFDLYRAKSYKNVYGKERFIPISYDEKVAPPSARQQRKGVVIKEAVTEIRQPYQCSWIVGTDYVYDTGKTHMAPRPQPSKPRLSFHFEQLLEPSMMELIYPILDQFMLTWYKYQNLRAQAIESGFAIDFGMLINLGDADGKKYPLNDILKMWKQTGVLPFMASRYGNYQGGAVTPVTPLPNNYLAGIQGIQADFQLQFMLFEQITGINPVALGQSPNPEAPVATTEAALQSTVNVLKPIISAVRELKENIATSIVSMIQTGIKAEDDIAKAYELVIGKNNLKAVKDAEKDAAQYGIMMQAKPDQLYKQSIGKYIQIALQSGRDGKAGIDFPEAMLLEERLLRGEDITQLRQDLTYFYHRNKQKVQEQTEQNIQLQNQGLQQVEQVKGQITQQNSMLEGQKLQMQETEKRKTERLKQNYGFINALMTTVQDEQKAGSLNPQTMQRLKTAMTIAGQVDLAEADLPTEVAKAEQMQGMPPMGGMPMQQMGQPTTPTFPQQAAPAAEPIM